MRSQYGTLVTRILRPLIGQTDPIWSEWSEYTSHCAIVRSFIRLEELRAPFETNSWTWSGIRKEKDAAGDAGCKNCRSRTCFVTKIPAAFNLLCVCVCVCIYGTLLVDITPSRRN